MGHPANPQSLNKYSYTINSPLRYTDPDGHCFWDACIIEGAIATKAIIIIGGGLLVAGAGVVAYFNLKDSHPSDPAPPPASSSPAQADTGPKRPGTLGKPDHQETVKEEAARIGGKPEVTIPTPGGKKGSRRVDAAQVGPDGKYLPGGEIVQVYRPTKTGKIPKREGEAASDVQNETGVVPQMVPVRPKTKKPVNIPNQVCAQSGQNAC